MEYAGTRRNDMESLQGKRLDLLFFEPQHRNCVFRIFLVTLKIQKI